MRKKISAKKSILIFLVLHTAIVTLFAYVVARSSFLPNSLLMIVSVALFSALITVYTVSQITRIVFREITFAMRIVFRLSDYLKIMAKTIHDYTQTLDHSTTFFNDYVSEIIEIVKEIDLLSDDLSRDSVCPTSKQ